jgi:hypothetical protein
MPVPLEEVVSLSGGEVVGRFHIANAMIARGYVASMWTVPGACKGR